MFRTDCGIMASLLEFILLNQPFHSLGCCLTVHLYRSRGGALRHVQTGTSGGWPEAELPNKSPYGPIFGPWSYTHVVGQGACADKAIPVEVCSHYQEAFSGATRAWCGASVHSALPLPRALWLWSQLGRSFPPCLTAPLDLYLAHFPVTKA